MCKKVWKMGIIVALACTIILIGLVQGVQAVDWKQHKGESIYILLNRHPYADSLVPVISEFEKKTGIKVDYHVLSEEEFYEKSLALLSARSPDLDVLMTGYYSEWQFLQWLEPLDKYLEDPALTDKKSYDFEDFFPSVVESHTWDGVFGHPAGTGSLWGIPIQVEAHCMYTNMGILEKFGLPVPTTYPELAEIARKATRTFEGKKMYGIVECGARTFNTLDNSFATPYFSWGAKDFDIKGNCVIDSPASVEISTLWNGMLRDSSTPDVINYLWYDEFEQFGTGKFAFMIGPNMWAPTYEAPESPVKDQVNYALPPKGPAGQISSHMFTWSVSINKASRHKGAAWLFVQWATTKEALLKSAVERDNFMPVRKSVFNHPDFKTRVKVWANWGENAKDLLENYASVQWTPNPKIFEVGDTWAVALQKIILNVEPHKALSDAASEITSIMKRAGL